MTPSDRLAALETIGWSQRELANRIGYSQTYFRALMQQDDLWLDRWLEKLAAFVSRNPPPERG